MTVRIITKNLVDLLADLVLTADNSKEAGTLGNVLIYSTRAAIGDEPGETDVLAGVGYDGWTVGHTYVEALNGQLARPVLWPVRDVKAVISYFKPAAAADPEHAVDVRCDAGMVSIGEDPNLFDDGRSISFAQHNIENYPGTAVFRLLGSALVPADAEDVPNLHRTDYAATGLDPFVKIARRRGGKLRIYREHQGRRVLVQIGDHYRGAVQPVKYEPHGTEDEPDVDILRPDMDQLAELTQTAQIPEQAGPVDEQPVDARSGESVTQLVMT